MRAISPSLLLDRVRAVLLLDEHTLVHHLSHEVLGLLRGHQLALAASQLELELLDPIVPGGDGLELAFLQGPELHNLRPRPAALAADLEEVRRAACLGRQRARVLDDLQNLWIDGNVDVIAVCQPLVSVIYSVANELREIVSDYRVGDVQNPLDKLRMI